MNGKNNAFTLKIIYRRDMIEESFAYGKTKAT